MHKKKKKEKKEESFELFMLVRVTAQACHKLNLFGGLCFVVMITVIY